MTWGPLAALLVTIVGFLLAQIIGVLLIAAIASIAGGHDVSELEGANSYLKEPGYIFLTNSLVTATLFGLIYGFMRIRGGGLKAVGLRKPRWSDASVALIGLSVYAMVFIVMNWMIYLTAPDLMNKNQDIGYSRESSGPILSLIFISLVLMPPLIEEFMLRGFLFSGLRSKLTYVWSALITSALFGLAHLFGGEGGTLIWVLTIDTFILSVILCHMREKSGGLWAPIMVHAVKNLVAFSVLFIFK